MFAVKVISKLLDGRLDAGFYRPDFLELIIRLNQLGAVPLITLVDGIACGPFGGNAIADELYAEEGVAFIRPVNISSLVFDESSLVRVPRSLLFSNKLKIYDGKNLYFGRVGDPCVALIRGETSISPNIIIAITNQDTADPYFLYAFCSSEFGLKQLLRQLKTVAQPTTSTEAIKGLLVLKPAIKAQTYIGDKVRQAEQLRAWAKKHAKEVDSLVTNELITAACRTENKKYNRPQIDDLTNRLDPKYYGNRAVAVFRQAKAIGILLASLVSSIANGFEERMFVDQGIDYITVTEVTSGRLDLSTAPRISAAADIPGKARIHDRCVLVVRTGSIGTAVKVDVRDRGAVISSHLIRLEFSDEATAAAVAAFLKSDAGKILQHKISYGAVQPQIGQDELMALPIPKFVIEAKDTILELITTAESAIRMSKSLTTSAKLLVEALIECQIDESILISAQDQLQVGDDSLDRSILARLKTDGLDGKGQPLFPDIDHLYALLTQAAQA